MITTLIGLVLTGTAAAGQLHVAVYDKSNVPEQVAKEAANNLRVIFRHSGMEVEWVAGAPDADEANFLIYDGVVTKDQEHRAACRARRDIAVAIRPTAPPGPPYSVMGMALPLATAGLNVQVYNDRIADVAVSRGTPHSYILGHAIAHEIGHVLLRSGQHDLSGLMAGVWTYREYDHMATGSLFFTSDQANRMRATMNGLGCPAAVNVSE
jgi:hypothetical protein